MADLDTELGKVMGNLKTSISEFTYSYPSHLVGYTIYCNLSPSVSKDIMIARYENKKIFLTVMDVYNSVAESVEIEDVDQIKPSIETRFRAILAYLQ